jgi:hypothetical protein
MQAPFPPENSSIMWWKAERLKVVFGEFGTNDVTIKNSPGSFRKADLFKVEGFAFNPAHIPPNPPACQLTKKNLKWGGFLHHRQTRYQIRVLHIFVIFNVFCLMTVPAKATSLHFPNSGQDLAPCEREGEDQDLTCQGILCKAPETGREALTGGVPTHIKVAVPPDLRKSAHH